MLLIFQIEALSFTGVFIPFIICINFIVAHRIIQTLYSFMFKFQTKRNTALFIVDHIHPGNLLNKFSTFSEFLALCCQTIETLLNSRHCRISKHL